VSGRGVDKQSRAKSSMALNRLFRREGSRDVSPGSFRTTRGAARGCCAPRSGARSLRVNVCDPSGIRLVGSRLPPGLRPAAKIFDPFGIMRC
jgi:hypothetical protein